MKTKPSVKERRVVTNRNIRLTALMVILLGSFAYYLFESANAQENMELVHTINNDSFQAKIFILHAQNARRNQANAQSLPHQ